MIGLSSKDQSLIQMSVLARWTIRPRLMGVPGVANVSIWGQRERQLQVQVDPERLRDNNISLIDIVKTAGNAREDLPFSLRWALYSATISVEASRQSGRRFRDRGTSMFVVARRYCKSFLDCRGATIKSLF